jgi:hypothetical protein
MRSEPDLDVIVQVQDIKVADCECEDCIQRGTSPARCGLSEGNDGPEALSLSRSDSSPLLNQTDIGNSNDLAMLKLRLVLSGLSLGEMLQPPLRIPSKEESLGSGVSVSGLNEVWAKYFVKVDPNYSPHVDLALVDAIREWMEELKEIEVTSIHSLCSYYTLADVLIQLAKKYQVSYSASHLIKHICLERWVPAQEILWRPLELTQPC